MRQEYLKIAFEVPELEGTIESIADRSKAVRRILPCLKIQSSCSLSNGMLETYSDLNRA